MSLFLDFHKFIETELNRYHDITYDFSNNKKSERLTIYANGKSRFAQLPKTPSDRRSWRNVIRDVRHTLRDLGVIVKENEIEEVDIALKTKPKPKVISKPVSKSSNNIRYGNRIDVCAKKNVESFSSPFAVLANLKVSAEVVELEIGSLELDIQKIGANHRPEEIG